MPVNSSSPRQLLGSRVFSDPSAIRASTHQKGGQIYLGSTPFTLTTEREKLLLERFLCGAGNILKQIAGTGVLDQCLLNSVPKCQSITLRLTAVICLLGGHG